MQRRTAGTVAFLATGLTLALVPSANAAGLDTTFGVNGTAFTPIAAAASDRYLGATAAPDGGTYNVGHTTLAGGVNRAFLLTKTTATGKLDTAFGTNGVATVDVATGPFIAPPVAPSGASQAAATPTGGAEGARGVGVQSDGKIIVLGQAETLQNGTAPDSRDVDVYVARFNVNGTLDTTFGVSGVRRIDLSDGRNQFLPADTATSLSTDQAGYNVTVRPDDRIIFTLSKGVDFDEPLRKDRDIVIAQLTKDGALDTAFGDVGTAGRRLVPNHETNVNENPRRGIVLADGKYVTTAYGPFGGQNRPYLIRLNADGTIDTAFGTNGNGIATDNVAGATGRAEAYGVQLHQGKYAVVGYGQRGTADQANNGSDILLFRFNADGTWDQSFGRDGLVNYDRLNPAGGAPNTNAGHFGENGRDFVVTPDERFVIAGQSGPDAIAVVRKADGSPDTSVSPDGSIVTDLGGPSDAFWGATLTKGAGIKTVLAGYKGFTVAGEQLVDDAALQQLDLTVPPVPTIPTIPTTPTTPTTPTVPTTPTTPKPSKTVGKVTVSAKRIGAKKNRVRVTLKLQRFGKGKVTVSAKRKVKGAKAVSAKGTLSKKGTLTVTLKTGKKGRYTLTIKVPTPAGGIQTIKRGITVK